MSDVSFAAREGAPQLDLTDHVAVVTGAARGLGRAEAVALARRGARVVLADMLPTDPVVAEIEREHGRAIAVPADLGTPEGAESVIRAALDAFGDVTSVVNNAGIVRDRMSFNLTDEDWESVLAVNLSGPFYVARAAVRHWRSLADCCTASARSIINTTSESGLYGNAGQANYAAAKAGVAALTLTMAAELEWLRVSVNAIAPRARTPMSVQAFGELPNGSSFDALAPEHVAAVVAWLASPAAHGITGQVFVVHGGGIEVMDTWCRRRHMVRQGPWSDIELAALRASLFPDDDTRYVAPPVGDLFTSGSDGGGRRSGRR